MRHSIRLKITLLLTSSIAVIIFLCWIVNSLFLTDYYQHSKIKAMDISYEEINSLLSGEVSKLNEEQQANLDQTSLNNNVNILLMNRILQVDLYDQTFFTLQVFYTSSNSKQIISKNLEMVRRYLKLTPMENDPELLKYIDGCYSIYKQRENDSFYIDLIGTLDNGNVILLRSNFETIQESVKISNKFLAFVGIFVAMLGTVAMFFISRSFSKPVLELVEVAKSMSDLDFDVKYRHQRKDEIGILGQSMNALSGKLEQTISELKSANNELQSDIENKIQIDEMRKEFLSNVTHELKTPIALIQGYAEGLQDNINDDAESRDFYCEVIIDEAVKMNKMVKKLLSLNQIESGKNQVELERFDLVALIKSVLNSVEILLAQKEVTLYFREQDPVYVWADEYMIEEVVTNYISNALNHVEEERIIDVKLVQYDNVVRISVFNTGETIPVDDLDKVWIKFYKVDKARTREYGGSGIGLSIVKAIMISHNKECGVVNHANGVEFWFELDAKI